MERIAYPELAALPRGLNGINAAMMREYVEYVGDFLMKEMGFCELFGANNPVRGL